MDHSLSYPLHTITFNGRPLRILLESSMGATPIVAITNALVIKGVLGLSPTADRISSSSLHSLLASILSRMGASHPEGLGSQDRAEFSRNIEEAIARLPELERGLVLTIGFTRINDFQLSDSLAIFDILGLPLVHGWLASPYEPAFQLFQSGTVNSRSFSQTRGGTAAPPLPAEAHAWFACHSSQLTSYGLQQLRAQIPAHSVRVFVRNDSYRCMYRHLDAVYTLVTDPARASGSASVWEAPDASLKPVFYTDSFSPLPEHPSSSVSDSASPPAYGTPPAKPAVSIFSPSPSAPSASSTSPSSSAVLSPTGSVSGQPKKIIVIENAISKETKTLRLPRWPTTYDALRRFVQTLFKELPQSFSVTYRDPDDDYISITTAGEFDEAIRLASDTGASELQIRVGPSLASVIMPQNVSLDSFISGSTLPKPTPQPSTPQPSTPSSTPVVSTPSSASPGKKTSPSSNFVPKWFSDQVISIFDTGHRYSPALIIESLIRNAANATETIAELQASGSKQVTGRRPNTFKFPKDFATSLDQIMVFMPCNPYAVASALIMQGGNMPEAVLALSSNLAQYEAMLTSSELSGSAAEPIPSPAPIKPSPQPSPQPSLQPSLQPSPQPSPQQPIPSPSPQPISAPTPQQQLPSLLGSDDQRLKELEDLERQEALRIEEAERKLQQEKAQYQQRLEEKRRLQTEQVRARLATVGSTIGEVTSKLDTLKQRQQEVSGSQAQLQTTREELRASIAEAEKVLSSYRRREEETSLQIAALDTENHQIAGLVADTSRRLEVIVASRTQLEQQLAQLATAPALASVAVSSLPPLSPSMASFSLPPSFLASLNTLETQGFSDHERNFQVLLKNGGDIQATIAELLD